MEKSDTVSMNSCKCKKNEFCDICLDNAINELLEQGLIKKETE